MRAESDLRCFVDCTETICSGINTGIQRTVRSIISRHAFIAESHGIEVVPVVALNGKFYRYNVDCDRKIFAPLLSGFFGSLRNLLDRLCYGEKINVDAPPVPPPDVSRVHVPLESKASHVKPPLGAHIRIVEFCRTILPFFFRCAFYLDNAFESLSEADIGPRDLIFYPDAFWYRSTYLSFTRYKVVKVLLLHDIIPVTMPEACDPVYAVSFRRTLAGVLDNVDGIISISMSELSKIRSFLAANGLGESILFDYNYWGANFATAATDSAKVNPHILEIFTGRPIFVMVGTLEPRKNHAFVLKAFEHYWRQGGEASLCIIGRVSMHCSELKRRIDAHELLGTRLFCLQDVDDVGLAYSYERCAGVVFASLAEGFGLPLVEAMWYGIPVLASDIDVFREIGGNYPEYFPPDDVQRLADLLQLHDSRPERREPCQWRSWDESVRELFAKVFTMADMIRSNRNSA